MKNIMPVRRTDNTLFIVILLNNECRRSNLLSYPNAPNKIDQISFIHKTTIQVHTFSEVPVPYGNSKRLSIIYYDREYFMILSTYVDEQLIIFHLHSFLILLVRSLPIRYLGSIQNRRYVPWIRVRFSELERYLVELLYNNEEWYIQPSVFTQ